MRIFLVTLLVSTMGGIALWNFGVANRIWPAHPLLVTVAIAAACGIAVQLVLTYETSGHKH